MDVQRTAYRPVRRVLVLAPGEKGERMAGPGIRAWELAKALSSEYEVTVATNRTDGGESDGISVIPAARRRLLDEVRRQDALLAAALPPYLMALHAPRGLFTISDQYDPHTSEVAALPLGRERERKLRLYEAIQALQLRHASLVLCASEHQRAELLRTAERIIGRAEATPDPIVVPFGIPDPPPHTGARPLRSRFTQLRDGDTIVLWWGSPWRWLDAESVVRAFAHIARTRDDVKLVITAGKPPNAGAASLFDTSEETRSLARDLGVLDRAVLFYDEWIPYEQRHDYLREADLGITLHRDADEARLAARARYMDYLSAELPCVLGRGDQVADEFGAAGFATLVEKADAESLAETLLALVDNRGARARAAGAGHDLAAQHHWSAIGAKLRDTLAATPRRVRQSHRATLLRESGAYYARRAVDRLVSSA